MSSEGGAAILIIPIGLVLGPAVLAAAAAAGVVIVVAGTAMWAGQQLHARYVDRCASWGKAEERLIAQSRARVVSLDALLAGPLTEFRRHAAAQPDNDGQMSPAQLRALDAEIQRALAEALTAPAAPAAGLVTDPDPRQRELEQARAELAMEVAIAREHGVASDVVDGAERALSDGDLGRVAAMRDRLREAWATVTESGRLRARQRELATIRLAVVRGTASVLRAQADTGALTLTPEQSARLAQIEGDARIAEGRLAVSPEVARQDAERLQGEVEEIERAVVITSSAAVTGVRAQAAQLKGRLTALAEMAREATVFHYATKADWLARVGAIETALAEPTPDLAALTARTDTIQREVFAAIDSGQGRAIAGQIAEVMGQSRFRQDAQGQRALEIEELGDGAYRVVGLRNDAPDGMGRDDKRVTFTLEPGDGENGLQITYDFAGYVGDACHADMRAIFDGLRNRGIIIADPRWQPPSGAALTQTEAQAAPGPEIVTNKQQALVTAALYEVFRRMGATDDEIEVTSTGGQAHLSLRKGDLGYYEYGVSTRGEVTRERYEGERPPTEALAPLREAVAGARSRSQAARASSARQRADEEEGYVRGDGAIQQ